MNRNLPVFHRRVKTGTVGTRAVEAGELELERAVEGLNIEWADSVS